MAKVKSSNSNSDTSTDSWTLIDEIEPEPNLSTSPPEPAEEPIELPEEPSQQDAPQKSRNDGFLSLDEFLQERLLEHDYEQDDKIEKFKKIPRAKKETRKCKAKNTGMLVFIVLILALSGFATLCSILTTPYHVSQVTKPKVEVTKVPMVPPTPPRVHVQPEVDRIVQHSYSPFEDGIVTNSEEDFCYHKPEQMNDEDVEIENPPEMFEELTINTTSFKELFRDHVHSRLRLLKQVLSDSNLQSLLSFVMINVYLFTLIATLYKQQMFSSSSKLENQTADNITTEEAEVREVILKQLPFWGQELDKSLHVSKRNKLAKLRKIQSHKRYKSRDFKEQIIESIKLLTKVIKPYEESKVEEPNMKAKKPCVGHIQRERVKLLKAKFSNEMSQIRERKMEENAKADAMHLTSQKFMMKLKNNRDKYLLELRRMKEARQARDDHKKDAAVGNYAVAMPAGYSFVEKLRLLQEKENERNRGMTYQFPKEAYNNSTRLICKTP